jgi:hypothetical protein
MSKTKKFILNDPTTKLDAGTARKRATEELFYIMISVVGALVFGWMAFTTAGMKSATAFISSSALRDVVGIFVVLALVFSIGWLIVSCMGYLALKLLHTEAIARRDLEPKPQKEDVELTTGH